MSSQRASYCLTIPKCLCGFTRVRASGSAHEREEVVDRELRLLQDMGERRPLYRAMRRHDDPERFLLGVLLQADVTAVLSHDDPAAALERADDSIVE